MAHHRRLVAPASSLLLALWLAVGPVQAATGANETALAREAGDHLLHGHVRAGLGLFEQAALTHQTTLERGPWQLEDAVLLAHILLRQGQPERAQSVLAPHLGAKQPAAAAVLAQAAILQVTAPTANRVALLGRALRAQPGDAQLVVALGAALLEAGKRREARKLLDPLADRYEAGQLREPLDLLAVAESLRLNGYVRDANRLYEEASQAATETREQLAVELASARLFVHKYNYRDGDKALRKVLAIDPQQPEAQVLMARIDVKSDQDVAKARKRLDGVLGANPRHLEALVARADVALHDEDFGAARRFLLRAHDQRPDHLPAWAVQAALAKLTDDTALFAEAERAARRINPDDGSVWLVAAEHLELAHRYGEAQQLLQLAIQVQPDLWQAHAALGMGHARVADDARAHKALETAYGGDPFDVRTANQLNVLYDGVLKQMVTLPGHKVDLRVHRKDRKAFEREMLPFLQEAVATLEKKYGFTPARPLQVEIFPETEQFSVRTVGLPQLGAHAVCFGHLITSRSPSERPFNWKMVLWHELSHIFHIQMTEGRVPRWLTEGLAMMESAWANPRWVMRQERRAYDRLKAGQLAHVATFNLAFSQAQSLQEIVDAYYQAMLLTEYMSERHGFARLRNLVRGYQSGAQTAALVQRELGVTPAELDTSFALWLGQRLARFDSDFRPYLPAILEEFAPTAPRPGAAQLAPAAETAETAETVEAREPAELAAEVTPPADAERPLRPYLAQTAAAFRAGNQRRALQVVTAGVAAGQAADGRQATAVRDLCTLRALKMDLLAAAGDKPGAAAEAEALIQVPDGQCDGVRQRAVLALAQRPDADPLPLVAHLTAASRLDPSDASVAALWLDVAERAHKALTAGSAASRPPWLLLVAPGGTPAEARARIRTIVALEPNEPKFAAVLARLAWQDWRADTAAAARQAALADLQFAAEALAECDPAGLASVLYEARRLQAENQPTAAIVPYRLAAERASTPNERKEAWCELAEVAARTTADADAAEAKRRCSALRADAP